MGSYIIGASTIGLILLQMDGIIGGIIVGLIVFILIFLILREVMCWYWKINERINLQREQNSLLKQLLKQESVVVSEKKDFVDTVFKNTFQPPKEEKEVFCPHCKKIISNQTEDCPECKKRIVGTKFRSVACEKCGHEETDINIKFCSKCGNKF